MKFRPIALICALALVVWGGFATASVVAQVLRNRRFGWLEISRFGWPDNRDDWAAWATHLGLAASIIGVLALVFGLIGLIGLVRRWAIHAGAVAVVVSVGVTFAALTISHNVFHEGWDKIATAYRDRIAFKPLLDPDGAPFPGVDRWWYFVTDMLVPLAGLVLVLWLLVLVTGAGKRRPGASSAAAVAAPHVPSVAAAIPHEDFRYAGPADPDETPVVVTEPETDAATDAEPEAEPEAESEVEQDVEPEAEPEAVAAPDEHAQVWFVTVQGADHGPYTRAQLRTYLDEGRLHDGTVTHLADGENRALAEVLA